MINKPETRDNNDMPLYLFHQGTNFTAYDLMGCHFSRNEETGEYEYLFRVWAPGADSVCVVGDITSWNAGTPMYKVSKGVWELKIVSENNYENSYYKYAVSRGGRTVLKADPYAFQSQTHAESASVIISIDSFRFTDSKWMSKRKKRYIGSNAKQRKHFYPSPMNIYEMHLGSWRTRNSETVANGQNYLNYREIADQLAPYLSDMGYTHVELLPIMEHPYDGSWGYQVTGYFAPTSRFGSPKDFAYFVNKLHKAGIGVILDWVPAHFPKDEHGLYEFDGAPLYEYQGRDRMEHKGWGTRCFDVGREEVQSFLISSALFWMRKYHVDGLRVDAVASMLYLDYDRGPGEWTPNTDGNNHCYEAIAFFKKLNSTVFAEFPDALMIAEESTAWPNVTKPASDGGLGFNFKWNMGFANDMFEYVSMDPIYRQYQHNKLTFPMMYAYSENYVLPVSHDEVVHGKRSLIDKMFGSYDEKFCMMRAYLAFMMTMPGKKLLFMGCEFAQFREWDFNNSLEWFMLKYPHHEEMQRYVKELNHMYLDHPEFWEIDDSWDGFKWIDADRASDNVVLYERFDVKRKFAVVAINFSPVSRFNCEFPVSEEGVYSLVLNSDRENLGGNGILLKDRFYAEKNVNGDSILKLDLPAYSAVILKKEETN